jgi:hypothetical protein
LNLQSSEEHQDYISALNQDTTNQICKFHNIDKQRIDKEMYASLV